MTGRIYDGRRSRSRAGIIALVGAAVAGLILGGVLLVAVLTW